METCKDLAGERCHAPGREQDRNKPLHENACAPNKKNRQAFAESFELFFSIFVPEDGYACESNDAK